MSDLLIVILVLLSILAVIIATAKLKINAFFSLITVSVIPALIIPGPSMVSSVLKDGFGGTLGAIGLIIVFGTCLGVLLDKSGATHGMANFILRFVKKEKSSRAIAIKGTVTGLPIFCDSGFVVLSGLNRSLSDENRTGLINGCSHICFIYHRAAYAFPGTGFRSRYSIRFAGTGSRNHCHFSYQ